MAAIAKADEAAASEEEAAAGSAEAVLEAAAVEAEASDVAASMIDHAKCTKSLAAHVEMKEKFLSNPAMAHLYSAETALRSRKAVHMDHAMMHQLENHKNQTTLNKSA